MKELEVTAKTVEEATQTALEQLGVDEDMIEVIVLKRGKPGVLGMGAEDAKIKVRLLSQAQSEGNNVTENALEVLSTLVRHIGVKAGVRVAQMPTDVLPLMLNIEGDDLGILIGRRGQTLASLQYVVRLMVSEKLKKWLPINVDVAGYKRRRYESLRTLALRLADQVKASQRLITLEPMPADERRIIHLALADNPDIVTQSVGEGEGRKVAILLKKR